MCCQCRGTCASQKRLNNLDRSYWYEIDTKCVCFLFVLRQNAIPIFVDRWWQTSCVCAVASVWRVDIKQNREFTPPLWKSALELDMIYISCRVVLQHIIKLGELAPCWKVHKAAREAVMLYGVLQCYICIILTVLPSSGSVSTTFQMPLSMQISPFSAYE